MDDKPRFRSDVPNVWVLYPVLIAVLVAPLIVLFAPRSVAERLGLLADRGIALFLGVVVSQMVMAWCVSRFVVYSFRRIMWVAAMAILLNQGVFVLVSADINLSALFSAATLFALSRPKVVNALGINFQRRESLSKEPVEVMTGGQSGGVEDPWLDGPG
jgi:hypothetical protein